MIGRDSQNEIIGRSASIGLGIIMSANVSCVLVGYFIAGKTTAAMSLELIVPILYALALADIGAGFIVKSMLLKPLYSLTASVDWEVIGKVITKTSIVLAALCSAPPLYGLLLVLLGGEYNHLIGFVIISLVGFMLLRPRVRDLEKIRQV